MPSLPSAESSNQPMPGSIAFSAEVRRSPSVAAASARPSGIGDDAHRVIAEELKPPLVPGVGHPGSDHGSTGYRVRFIVRGARGG